MEALTSQTCFGVVRQDAVLLDAMPVDKRSVRIQQIERDWLGETWRDRSSKCTDCKRN